jgi:hypothetical protein
MGSPVFRIAPVSYIILHASAENIPLFFMRRAHLHVAIEASIYPLTTTIHPTWIHSKSPYFNILATSKVSQK